MYDVIRKKKRFEPIYPLVILALFATAFYFQDYKNWAVIVSSGFPLEKHIMSRLAFVWYAFWPAIMLAILYPFAKVSVDHVYWGAKFLAIWRVSAALIIGITWFAMFFGS